MSDMMSTSDFINTTDFAPNTNTTRNSSVLDGCKILQFDGFVPWDNPDNLVSLEVEAFFERFKGAIVLPLLFLIGGPANVINMAVFYKHGLSVRINLCLFALSLADELYLMQCMFLNGERIHGQFTSSQRSVDICATSVWYMYILVINFIIACWGGGGISSGKYMQ